MAYEVNQDDEEQLNQQQQQTNGQIQVPTTSGSGLLQPVGQSQQSTPTQGSSQKFPTIQAYLGANQDQIGKETNQIVNRVTQKARAVYNPLGDDGATQDAVNQYTADLRREVPQVPESVNPILGKIGQGQTGEVSNLTADQRQAIQANLQKTAFQTKPEDFSKYLQPVEFAARQVDDDVKSLQNETGRFDMLRQSNRKPTYSQGQQNLDQAMLQLDPTAKDKLASLQSLYPQLQQAITETGVKGQQAYDFELQQMQAKRQAMLDQLQGGYDQLQGSLIDRQSTAEAKNNALMPLLLNRFNPAANPLLQDIAKGPRADFFDARQYGVDPRDYLQQGPEANLAAYGSAQEADQLRQLAELAGFDTGNFDYNQAGQTPRGPSFDVNGYVDQLYANSPVSFEQLRSMLGMGPEDNPQRLYFEGPEWNVSPLPQGEGLPIDPGTGVKVRRG
jgi:hypothetical protein